MQTNLDQNFDQLSLSELNNTDFENNAEQFIGLGQPIFSIVEDQSDYLV